MHAGRHGPFQRSRHGRCDAQEAWIRSAVSPQAPVTRQCLREKAELVASRAQVAQLRYPSQKAANGAKRLTLTMRSLLFDATLPVVCLFFLDLPDGSVSSTPVPSFSRGLLVMPRASSSGCSSLRIVLSRRPDVVQSSTTSSPRPTPPSTTVSLLGRSVAARSRHPDDPPASRALRLSRGLSCCRCARRTCRCRVVHSKMCCASSAAQAPIARVSPAPSLTAPLSPPWSPSQTQRVPRRPQSERRLDRRSWQCLLLRVLRLQERVVGRT